MKPIKALIQKGVNIPNPDSIEIGDDIEVDRIAADGVTIHSGCKLYGSDTYIAKGAQIGFEAPVTIKGCYIGPFVELKGGYFQDATFLERSSCGLGAHVRQGTILEEETSIAHTVGLKQTILFPYVTLGSLINFCDCLMAGGTSRQNHSEVGSSYIHFNYTPNQDKATPSIIGDVSHGVMLNQSPVFLGGQGGLVGPCRLAYGTVVAAGCICRKDQYQEDHLIIEGGLSAIRVPFKTGRYQNLKRVIGNNIYYISNLIALWQWYKVIRRLFVGPGFSQALFDGLLKCLKMGLDERIQQLTKLRDKIKLSFSDKPNSGIELDFCANWDKIQCVLLELDSYEGTLALRDQFCAIIEQLIQNNGKSYIRTIKTLTPVQSKIGSQWLQSIVDQVNHKISLQINLKG